MIFSEILSDVVETTIWSLLAKINNHRDLEKNYDAPEAHNILQKQHFIKSLLEFSEELPFGDGVFTYERERKTFLKTFCCWHWPLRRRVHK